ncbi:MAG: ATP-binding protein [Actinomycetota bacterium]
MGELVGREDELAWLERQLGPDVSRTGRLVLVAGEAGMGKTRLAQEAIPEGMRLGWITFPHARFAAPGFGLRQLARAGREAGRALEAQLTESHGAEVGPWKFLVIAQAADDVLRASGGQILVLDDLQWADELTLAWLSQVSGLLADTPSRIIALVRAAEGLPTAVAEAVRPLAPRGAVAELRLGPLSVEAVAALAKSLGHERVARSAREIHARTDGVPVAVKALVERAGLSNRAVQVRAEPAASMPVILSLVSGQLLDLPSSSRRLVAVASLFPPPITERLVRVVCGLGVERFDEVLQAALASGLIIRSGGGTLSFRHDLHREAVQEALPLSERRALHREIAAALSREPNHPAEAVAAQLLEASLPEQAGEWFERAAEEARRVHDRGTEFVHLRHAIELDEGSDPERLILLAEQLTLAARDSNHLADGVEVLGQLAARMRTASQRGRLSLCRARLAAFSGRYQERIEMLERAGDDFASIGDRLGLARCLAEMSLPVGTQVSPDERVAFGRRALGVAQEAGDPSTVAFAASNLAVAELVGGNPGAFDLFALSARALESVGPAGAEEAGRNHCNWAIAAVGFGDHAEAEHVIRAGLRLSRAPVDRTMLHAVDALRLWRMGRWDESLDAIERAREDVSYPEVRPLADALETIIRFEREPRPDPSPLARATDLLVEMSDENWAAIAHAMLMRLRVARREPHPARGLPRILDLLVRTGSRIGWDDLLPSTAEVNPAECGRMLVLLGDLRPVGKRSAAAERHMTGLLPGDQRDREGALLEAAEAYLALPEPHSAARAFEACAAIRVAAGKRAGDLRARAARIYSDLGADRSLATLIRRSGGSRALDDFRIPRSQAYSGAPGLTPREHEIAELARRGHTASEIGQRLSIASGTVAKHLERIKRKLGARRKRDLVRILSRDGD